MTFTTAHCDVPKKTKPSNSILKSPEARLVIVVVTVIVVRAERAEKVVLSVAVTVIIAEKVVLSVAVAAIIVIRKHTAARKYK